MSIEVCLFHLYSCRLGLDCSSLPQNRRMGTPTSPDRAYHETRCNQELLPHKTKKLQPGTCLQITSGGRATGGASGSGGLQMKVGAR
jgi:hypothetical protein